MNKFLKLALLSGLTALVLTGCNKSAKSTKPATEQCSQIVSAATCEKIGQLLIVGFGGMDISPAGEITWNDPNGASFKENSNVAHDITDWHVGGVILFRGYLHKTNGQFLRYRNIQDGELLTRLNADLQAYNNKTRQQQQLPPAPLLISIDQEGGLVDPLSFAPGLPNITPQSLGKNEAMNIDDPQKRQAALSFTHEYGKTTAQYLHDYGFNLNFAPDVDVNVNPVNPIIGALGRSYSDNPEIVADQAAQVINGFHSLNILAALKHFPGHGSSTGDTHKGLVDVTNTYQMDKELAPYKILIGQGYNDFIMSTHVINGQIDRTQCIAGNANNPETWCPGTMSYKTLTELLRNQLHYQGVIVSDDMAMGAIADHYPLATALEKGLNAGIDMFIVANHHTDNTADFVNTIAKLVRDGKVPQSRIDDAYQHVMAAKKRLIK